MKAGLRILCAFLVALALGAGHAYAQAGATAQITGTVRDSSGGVLPGVDVGGKGLLSGTAAKLSRGPPRGPTSRKMPPLLPVLVPGFFPAVISFPLFNSTNAPVRKTPQLPSLGSLGYAQRS